MWTPTWSIEGAALVLASSLALTPSGGSARAGWGHGTAAVVDVGAVAGAPPVAEPALAEPALAEPAVAEPTLAGSDNPLGDTPAPHSRLPLRGLGLNFDGLVQDDVAPGQPADVVTAVGRETLVETANSRLAAYDRSGRLRCAVELNVFLGADTRLAHPRVQYDAVNDRYSLVVAPEPGSASAPAELFLATTYASDPCASWYLYRFTLTGPLFPSGSQLLYPHLGQDPQALLLSSNNFAGGGYVGSAVFALPKAAVYAGAEVDFPTFAVAFGTAPVTTTEVADDAYFVAAEPQTGYLIYRMVNSAGPGTVLQPEASIAAPYAAPSRRIRQCSGATLDPLDGRNVWQPVRVGDHVWFAHDFDAAGRPGVRYGAIHLFSHVAHLATAAYSATSDDFNPSIGVSDAGDGLNFVWLNWAYTDTAAQPCADVSVVADGLAPGSGLPDRLGSGVVLVRGGGTQDGAPFGRYSSVAVDPTATGSCPAGRAAVVAQQYFGADGQWRTRIARVGFC